jgi:hypothetical protein
MKDYLHTYICTVTYTTAFPTPPNDLDKAISNAAITIY